MELLDQTVETKMDQPITTTAERRRKRREIKEMAGVPKMARLIGHKFMSFHGTIFFVPKVWK